MHNINLDLKRGKLLNKFRKNASGNILVLIVLIIGLIAGLILIFQKQLFKKEASTTNASLSLPSSKNVNVGENFDMQVMLNTDSLVVNAVDLQISFDPSYLQVVSVNTGGSTGNLTTFLPQTSGSFDNNTVVTNANNTGIIEFGAVAHQSGGPVGGFNGILGATNPLAVITFKALRYTASTPVKFIFNGLGATNDTNLAGNSTSDLLNLVNNSNVTINSTASDTTRPNVSISNPSSGAIVSRNSSINIKANASDNVGIAKVDFYVNNSLIGTEYYSPYTKSWTLPSAKRVQYTIMAKAYDAAGNSASSTIYITSSN